MMTLQVDPDFFELLCESHRRSVGHELCPSERGARWLYEDAPFAVVAHNTDPDPRFVYANRTAQRCFEYSWDEFVALPSRLSAQAAERAAREQLLEQVAARGFLCGYRGLRIAKSGRRFWIENGTVWQLIDRHGLRQGQAALFSRWRDAAPP